MRRIIGAILFMTMTSWAAENDRIDALERQLSELMSKQAELQARTDKLCAHWTDALELDGYGEMRFSKASDEDVMRSIYSFVPSIAYPFGERITLNVELEFAYEGHGGDGSHDVLSYSYIDFVLHEAMHMNLGHLLVPVGNANLGDEPPLFLGVDLPETESYVIPTTRHHNGLLFSGRIAGQWQYYAGVLDSINDNEIGIGVDSTADDNESHTSHAAPVARLDYISESAGFEAGVSYLGGSFSYHDESGNHGQGEITLLDAHLNYRQNGWDVKLLGVALQIKDGAFEGRMSGSYGTVGYDIMPLLGGSGELMPYVGYERYDNLITESVNWVVNTKAGVRYRPHKDVLVKADYRVRESDDARSHTAALGVGYLF